MGRSAGSGTGASRSWTRRVASCGSRGSPRTSPSGSGSSRRSGRGKSDSIPWPMPLLSSSGALVRTSSAVTSTSNGLTSRDGPSTRRLGDGWTRSVHPEDLERCLETYATAFDARKPFTMEYRLRRHDGKYRWVLDNGVPRFAADGTFSGYIGSCLDITDRRRAEVRTATERGTIPPNRRDSPRRDLGPRPARADNLRQCPAGRDAGRLGC